MAQILYQPAHGRRFRILIAGEQSVLRQYQPLNCLTTFGGSFNENEDRAHFTVGQGAIEWNKRNHKVIAETPLKTGIVGSLQTSVFRVFA